MCIQIAKLLERVSQQFFLLMWLVMPLLGWAGVPVDNLYTVELEAPSKESQQRNQLFRTGLEKVVTRLSGSDKILTTERTIQALASAETYVAEYGYRDNQCDITFAEDMVNELVLKSGQPIWHQNRPKVLMWLAIAENDMRRIIGMETEPHLYQKLQQYTQDRGLPLVLPLMDLADLHQVSVSDIWGQFPSVLLQASKRYSPDLILIGKVQADLDQKWSSAWQLLSGTTVMETWTSQAENLEGVLWQSMDQVIVRLIRKHGIAHNLNQSRSILISIQNIHSLPDFSQAEFFLNNLDQIKDVHVKEVSEGNVVFELDPKGQLDKTTLSQVLNLETRLVAISDDYQKQAVDLAYRWTVEGK